VADQHPKDRFLERNIRREQWIIHRNGEDVLVLFTPAQSMSEIQRDFPRYKGCPVRIPE